MRVVDCFKVVLWKSGKVAYPYWYPGYLLLCSNKRSNMALSSCASMLISPIVHNQSCRQASAPNLHNRLTKLTSLFITASSNAPLPS